MKTRLHIVVFHGVGVTESDIIRQLKLPFDWYVEDSEMIQ